MGDQVGNLSQRLNVKAPLGNRRGKGTRAQLRSYSCILSMLRSFLMRHAKTWVTLLLRINCGRIAVNDFVGSDPSPG